MPRTATPQTSTARPVPTPVEETRATSAPDAVAPRPQESPRETAESLVVALILALLIRAFAAEAFVIPTGSMAPTLMGRHKEVACPECGNVYAVNASEEDARRAVTQGTCVNCRFTASLDQEPSFKGDRILVNKFLYDLPFLPGGKPERWDVVVFKYPEEPEVNYIKRLVGLPGEEVRIFYGDVFVRPAGTGGTFRIARKPLKHQDAMQILVYDDRYRPKSLEGKPEWRRWRSSDQAGWTEDFAGTFSSNGSNNSWTELGYSHLVPDSEQWAAVLTDRSLPRAPRASLITDFYSYNTNVAGNDTSEEARAWLQPDWVGDLALECTIRVRSPKGTLRLRLVRGGVAYDCELGLSSGSAWFEANGTELCPAISDAIIQAGSYRVRYANIDGRLTLEIDGKPMFGEGIAYRETPDQTQGPTEVDLHPASIFAQLADVEVSDLVLKRDIYYTQSAGDPDYQGIWSPPPLSQAEMFDVLSDPDRYKALGPLKSSDYPLGTDRFLMMGDNSPRSRDGRAWGQRDRFDPEQPEYGWDVSNRASWEVPRSHLVGKAFFVYWPHGKPFGPDIRVSRDIRLPFRPYFERMGLIR